MSPPGNMPVKAALTVSLPSQLTTVGDWPRPRQGSRGLFSIWRFNSTFRRAQRLRFLAGGLPNHQEDLDMRDAARLLGEGPIEIHAVPWWFHFNITDSEGDRVFERTHSCP
jgi:hypothetical protein